MDWKRTLVVPALLGAMWVGGCTDDDASTVTLNLTVNSFEPDTDPAPVPDAEVCVLDTEDCVMTDADGLAVVTLPADVETGLTVTAAGYNPTLVPQTTGEDFVSDQTTTVLGESVATTLAALLGIDYPLDGTGVVALNAFLPPPDAGGLPGAVYDLAVGSGGEYYLTAEGFPTYDLDATTSFGSGGYVEVPPGVIEIDIGGTARDCMSSAGWPGSTSSSIRLPVRDGFFSLGVVSCAAVGVNVTVLGAEVPFGESMPLEGAEVCQDGTENCATTDAAGQATLDIPGNVELAYSITSDPDYFPQLSPQVSDSDIVVDPQFTLLLNSTVSAFAALLDTPFPPTTGVSAIVVYEKPYPETTGVSGASFELIDGTGEPYYLDDSNIPTDTLTETQSNGTGGFYEVAEGTLEVRITGASGCDELSNAWPGSEPSTFRMPSRDGFQTVAVVRCDE